MKVAITGSTGYIGRKVMTKFQGRPDCTVIVPPRDVIDNPDNCFERMGKPDCLVHLAWEGLPNYKSEHHMAHMEVQYEFLYRAITGGLRSLLVTGTCAEYGLQSGCLDEAIPTIPNTPYARAKDSLRKRLEVLQKQKQFDLTWARLFYIYGKDQGSHTLFGKLRDCAYAAPASGCSPRGRATFEMSAGEQIRDYMIDWDVAYNLMMLAGGNHGIVNICSGRPAKIKDLVAAWIEANSWWVDMKLGVFQYNDYEPMEFWGDPSKLRTILNPMIYARRDQ